MAQRVFLHIGPPKTGTSFLQAAWHQHRGDMRTRGLLYPGNDRVEHFQAAAAATAKRDVVQQMLPQAAAAWDRLTTRVGRWDGDALLSSEHYALGRRGAIAPIMQRLSEVAEEVHLVVGARDLARQIPADWQQTVKQGSTTRFEEFLSALERDEHPSFWRAQHLPSLLDAWGGSLPPERVHVVVLGRPGSPHTLLWERMCAVLGIEGDFLRPVARSNESINATQAELIRQMNEALGEVRKDLVTKRVMRRLIADGRFDDVNGATKLLLPREAAGWVAERSRQVVEELGGRGYDVHGDLEDLLLDDSTPLADAVATVTPEQIAALAPAVVARLVEHEVERRHALRERERETAGVAERLQELENESFGSLARRTAERAVAGAKARLRR
ncbi:MAG: hypothetical protein ACI379_01485 [Nocardioides sp.]|uniref:hypothetical protein n=1 Tax=Nocardioides sp. TaxID=35761 RepID=UPI003F06E857